MIDFIIRGSQLLLSLSILVVLHELGHFIPAKIFKTRVRIKKNIPRNLSKQKLGNRIRNRMVTIRWLCKDCRNDRRVDGQRANGSTSSTLGI